MCRLELPQDADASKHERTRTSSMNITTNHNIVKCTWGSTSTSTYSKTRMTWIDGRYESGHLWAEEQPELSSYRYVCECNNQEDEDDRSE